MKVDIIIIGGGPAGYETALEAARQGKSVLLFNGGKLGGTCLNEGCIPTKCLCRNAELIANLKNGLTGGIDDYHFAIDYNKILARKEDVVTNLRNGVEGLLKSAGVEVINSFAKFKTTKSVESGGEEYFADNILICTGSLNKKLPIPGAELECVMDSTKILSLEYIPARLTIIGGGVIGMEFASVFHQLGSKVTVIEFMKQILPGFDTDIAKRLKQTLSKRGIEIITGASAKEIRQNEFYEIEVIYEAKGKEGKVTSSDLLMAVGRKPNLEGLNLEGIGIEYTTKGITTDDFMRTNIPGIYACGDVNGKLMLAHVATFQGIRALNAINGVTDKIDFSIVPSAVFTVPECGMVGLTEEKCKEENIPFTTGISFYRANGKALALGEPDGLCKLIFNKENKLLIGAHIMGTEAADLAQQCADLMNRKTSLDDIENIIFGHPTVSELILNAARAVKI